MKPLTPIGVPLCEQMAIGLVGKLGALRFFPSDPAAREAVVDLLIQMCETEQQAAWLMRRMTSGIYNEWPGLAEMRACYCSRFRPQDGLERCSEVFSENRFPPDPEVPTLKQIETPRLKEIERGGTVTEDPELAESFAALMEKTEMLGARLSPAERRKEIRFNALLSATITAPSDRTDPPMPPPPTPQVITQADVDKILAEKGKR